MTITSITDTRKAHTTPALTVYTTPGCVQCTPTLRMLDDRGVTYTHVDLSEDPTAMRYVQGLGYKAAPVLVLDSEQGQSDWSGFRPDLIATHFPKAES